MLGILFETQCRTMHGLRIDRAIGQFRKRLVSITEVKGDHVEHLNSAKHDAPVTAVIETNRFQGCPIARSTCIILLCVMRDDTHDSYNRQTAWQGRRNGSGRPGGCRTNNLISKNFYVHIISIFENGT